MAKRDREGRQETIDLDLEASKDITAYCEKRGGRGIKKFVLSRLVKWFSAQPDFIKDAVIGWVPEETRAPTANVLRKMADDLAGNVEVVSRTSKK